MTELAIDIVSGAVVGAAVVAGVAVLLLLFIVLLGWLLEKKVGRDG